MTYGEALLGVLGFMGGPLMMVVYMFIVVLILFQVAVYLEEEGSWGWSFVPGVAAIVVIFLMITLGVWMVVNGVSPHSWEIPPR